MRNPQSTGIEVIAERVERGATANPLIRRGDRNIFADTYARTGSLSQSCRAAGISEPTGRKWLSEPRFVAEVFRSRQMALSGEGASVGYRVLLDICTAIDPDTQRPLYPVAERRQAATQLLRLGGHSEALAAQAAAGQAAAALHELSVDQLEAHIAAAQATLNALSAPPSPRITPDSADAVSLL